MISRPVWNVQSSPMMAAYRVHKPTEMHKCTNGFLAFRFRSDGCCKIHKKALPHLPLLAMPIFQKTPRASCSKAGPQKPPRIGTSVEQPTADLTAPDVAAHGLAAPMSPPTTQTPSTASTSHMSAGSRQRRLAVVALVAAAATTPVGTTLRCRGALAHLHALGRPDFLPW